MRYTYVKYYIDPNFCIVRITYVPSTIYRDRSPHGPPGTRAHEESTGTRAHEESTGTRAREESTGTRAQESTKLR